MSISGGGTSKLELECDHLIGQGIGQVKGLPVKKSHFRRAAKGEVFSATIKLGEVFWEVQYLPELDAEVPKVLALVMDVTKRVQIELDLDEKLFEKNTQIAKLQVEQQEMLDHMRHAVMTFDKDLKINRGYSKYLEYILESPEDFVGESVIDLIFKGSSIADESLRRFEFDLHTIFGGDDLQWLCSSHAFPKKITVKGVKETRSLKLVFEPVFENQKVRRIMLIIEDVTKLEQMEKKANQRKEELTKLADLLAVDEAVYSIFKDEAKKLVNACKKTLSALDSSSPADFRESLDLLFRYIHTLKGSSGLFKLGSIQNAAHEFETFLANVREDGLGEDQDILGKLIERVEFIEKEVESYETLRQKMFGGSSEDVQKFSQSHVQWLVTLLNRLTLNLGKQSFDPSLQVLIGEVKEALSAVRKTPIKFYISRFSQLVADIAAMEGKEVSPLRVYSGIHYFERDLIARLSEIIVHCLSNSVSHGIETPEKRRGKGKSPKGIVCLRFSKVGQKLRMAIEDDGGGIDPRRLIEKSVSKGIITPEDAKKMTPQEAINLIFASGLSSKDDVSMASGRGVGMDAVEKMVHDMGGGITLDSEVGSGTTIIIEIPYTDQSLIQDHGLFTLEDLASPYFRFQPDEKGEIFFDLDRLSVSRTFFETHKLLAECGISSSQAFIKKVDSDSDGEVVFELTIAEELASAQKKRIGEAAECLMERSSPRHGAVRVMGNQTLQIAFNSFVTDPLVNRRINIISKGDATKDVVGKINGYLRAQFPHSELLSNEEYASRPGELTFFVLDEQSLSKIEVSQLKSIHQKVVFIIFSRHPDLMKSEMLSSLPNSPLVAKLPIDDSGIAQMMELALSQNVSLIDLEQEIEGMIQRDAS